MFVYAITEIPQTRAALKNVNDPRWCVRRHGEWDCLGRNTMYSTLLNILVWPIIITAFSTAAYVVLVRRLYRQFGWEEFRILNASFGMKREF